jgi:hypothetical protein
LIEAVLRGLQAARDVEHTLHWRVAVDHRLAAELTDGVFRPGIVLRGPRD